ncbi:allophanate hydrolase [Dermatobacter hominis]|uniref:allophanate hydrolase n=1 Tax=Dermatobacter hominis TaxID=2884263 RepID=UPI001D12DD19|nr:allophanate hydrolase [Dermatobacter hominis]UDY35285.1 allophanate hydrolase [Dermatobacter hominis]
MHDRQVPTPAGVEERVAASLRSIAACDRPEIWIHPPDHDAVLAEAAGVAGRLAAGEHLPLAGATVAVKGNIDVEGWPTTAGCPSYGTIPERSATVVRRLREAGAVVVGATNMDQFATGLVGTRSPYGVVRNAVLPDHISGGSSSGSAVAVALGLVDLALGTDTAGSGRVPAALNGIVGLKPTRGWVSGAGVVPACRSLDCVSVFARDVSGALQAVGIMAAEDLDDPWSRARGPVPDPVDPSGYGAVIGVPDAATLAADPDLDPELRAALLARADRLSDLGHRVVELDLTLFLETATLLYGGGFVAERYDAVGRFVDGHPDEVDPVVGPIISAAGRIPAHSFAADLTRLADLAHRSAPTWSVVDALLIPTIPRAFTIAEVQADPVRTNSVLGRWTNFCNLLDLAALSLPAGRRSDGLPVGVTLTGPAWSDRRLARIGAELIGEAGPVAAPTPPTQPGPVQVVVVGAHLRGQPLEHQLLDRGGRFVAATTTAPHYRMHLLDGPLPKPGLVRVAEGGVALDVEVWELGAADFGDFVASVALPHSIGRVRLADGSEVPGFLCEPAALAGAPDISDHGGWRAFLRARS